MKCLKCNDTGWIVERRQGDPIPGARLIELPGMAAYYDLVSASTVYVPCEHTFTSIPRSR